MAFSEKYTPTASERCMVCRRKYTDGRKISYAAYRSGTEHVCRTCYKRYYKKPAELEAGSNLAVQLRPADIRERGLIFRREEPEGGYEVRMPEVMPQYTLRTVLMWLLLLCSAETALYFGTKVFGYEAAASPAWMLLRLLGVLVTALGAIRYVQLLIRGLSRGMGHFRRFVLFAALAVSVTVLILLIP